MGAPWGAGAADARVRKEIMATMEAVNCIFALVFGDLVFEKVEVVVKS